MKILSFKYKIIKIHYQLYHIQNIIRKYLSAVLVNICVNKYDSVNPPLIYCNKCGKIFKRHMELAKHRVKFCIIRSNETTPSM